MNTTIISSRGQGVQLQWVILATCVLSIGLSFALAPAVVNQADHIGYMLRVTARIAFVFLILAYIATPMARLFGMGKTLVRNRRYLGLSMALAHTVHFGYVVAYLRLSSEPVGWLLLIGGGGAFVTMWLMALTSNNYSMRLLGKHWKTLHRFGLHYLWIVFMQTLLGVLLAGANGQILYGGIVGVGIVALLMRIAAYWRLKIA